VEYYVERTVSQFNDSTFRSHFRMGRECFNILLERLQPQLVLDTTASLGRRLLTPDKQLMVSVWILANQESFRYICV